MKWYKHTITVKATFDVWDRDDTEAKSKTNVEAYTSEELNKLWYTMKVLESLTVDSSIED